MAQKTLSQVVVERPFPEYAVWWRMGREFIDFISVAIVSEWKALSQNNGDLAAVIAHTTEYLQAVFEQAMRPGLVEDFVIRANTQPIQSGEFDALSYAFYRSAFELIEQHLTAYSHSLERERRLFTKRVGKTFFQQVHDHLALNLPADLESAENFSQLKAGIETVGKFLQTQGYLRDHFRFTFEVEVAYNNTHIQQTEAEFLSNLHRNGLGYALYEMGYAVILPSAVYLYHTLGEAQHHSSRTIEELFERVGYEARETDDFDPLDHPSDLVVELWEIRALS